MSKKKVSHSEPGGNTKTPGKTTPKITDTQCYRWSFTLKAYTGEPDDPILIDPKLIHANLADFCKEFYYQREVGESGYEHYQGCFSLKIKHRMSEVKNILGWNDVHLEKAMNWHALKNYCMKNDTREAGPWTHESKWLDVIPRNEFLPWMETALEILEGPIDKRTIYWFWDREGGVMKSQFCKWGLITKGWSVQRGGALKDIAYSLPEDPKIVLFDFPRNCQEHINYSALEEVKDGMIFSAKYESKMKVFNSPHVMCFANYPPVKDMLSQDRWYIRRIAEGGRKLVLH